MMDPTPLDAAFAASLALCEELRTPFCAGLLECWRDDAAGGGGDTVRLLADRVEDDVQEWDLFRVLAGVHMLVLEGRAPELARHYPTMGGDGDAAAAWPLVRAEIVDDPPEVAASVAHPLQSNVPTRALVLVGGCSEVGRRSGLPLRLLEVGSSAGLNLRLDQFRYEEGAAAFGPPDSALHWADRWGGRAPFADGFSVAERRGCDLDPVDVATAAGKLTLRACVFADEVERLATLDRAIAIAEAVPAAVDRASLDLWLADRLAEPAQGLATVVVHTIVWGYLPADVREGAEANLRVAGEGASESAPLALLAYEPSEADKSVVELRLTTWPGGDQTLLARSDMHPHDVEWLA